MKNREPYDLTKVIYIYNVFQVFLNLYIGTVVSLLLFKKRAIGIAMGVLKKIIRFIFAINKYTRYISLRAELSVHIADGVNNNRKTNSRFSI